MKRTLGGHSGGFGMADVLVVLAVLLVICAITLRAANTASEADKRVECAKNLQQIGQAITVYTYDNKGPYPRCKYDASPEKSSKPTAYTFADLKNPFVGDKIPVNDVTAAMFLLVRGKYVTADKFVCPSTSQQAMVFGEGKTAADYSNFPDNTVLSYSYANPYPCTTALGSGFRMVAGMDPAFVVAGDMNPGGDDLTKLKATMTPEELRKGNSRNHGQDGQNFLYGDGHVAFQNTPFAGMGQDNVYTYGASGKDGGGDGVTGSPQNYNDSVLLPTAEDGKPAKKD